jgi:hypothetical protein
MATQSPAVLDRFAYIDADETVGLRGLELKKAREACEIAEREARQALQKLPALFLATDHLQRQCWNFEGLADEADKTLESLTGEDSECWFHNWNKAHEILEDLTFEQCRLVVELRQKAKDAGAKASEACDEWLYARQLAAKRFDEENPERTGT